MNRTYELRNFLFVRTFLRKVWWIRPQDCIYSEIWLQMSIISRGFYLFEPNLDRKFLQAPFMYCWCICGKRRILACILQHNNEVIRGKFWKMFDNRAKIEQITVKTRFIRHRWCRESTITSALVYLAMRSISFGVGCVAAPAKAEWTKATPLRICLHLFRGHPAVEPASESICHVPKRQLLCTRLEAWN